MPASRRSFAITNAYRRALLVIGARAEAQAREHWPTIRDLDDSDWATTMAKVVARAQTQAVRLSAGYLSAYVRSETGKRGELIAIDSALYAGLSRDGRPLIEAMGSPFIAVLGALADHRPAEEALRIGLVKGVRFAGFETVQAGRDALLDTIDTDDRFKGWQRDVAGTCAACMALSGIGGPRFEVHPGCECVPAPEVTGTSNRFPLPTGAALFAALTEKEQVQKVGAEAAQLIRDGDADLKDFVAHSKNESDQPDFITQKPVQDVPAT